MAIHTAVRRLPLNVEALSVAVLLICVAGERTPLGKIAARCEVAAIEDLVQR